MKNKLNEGGFLNVTKIIAFANQKGGVAKTTSAIALAQTLAMEGKRILFLDLDPQENASNTLRVNHNGKHIRLRCFGNCRIEKQNLNHSVYRHALHRG